MHVKFDLPALKSKLQAALTAVEPFEVDAVLNLLQVSLPELTTLFEDNLDERMQDHVQKCLEEQFALGLPLRDETIEIARKSAAFNLWLYGLAVGIEINNFRFGEQKPN